MIENSLSMWSPGSVATLFSYVCSRYGLSATPGIRCSAMIGRVDGFTCHSNVPDAGIFIHVSSVSRNRIFGPWLAGSSSSSAERRPPRR